MKKVILVGLLALVLGRPTPAAAATLGFEGLGHHDVVTIGGLLTGSFYAGELNWQWLGEVPDGFTDNLYTYCVDLLTPVADPQDAQVQSLAELPNTTADAGGKIGWLFQAFAEGIRTGGTDIQAAALQVAIWEALYDAAPDLTSGNFLVVTTAEAYAGAERASAIAAQANLYLAQLFNSDGSYNTYYSDTQAWLSSAIGQDQVTRVPEPTSLLMLGSALLVSGRYLRARRSGRLAA